MKDLLYQEPIKFDGLLSLPNTVVQKDEKPHTAGLNDTAIPHIKIQITEKTLGKKLNIAIP